MKKFNLLFLIGIMFAFATAFVACSGDDDDVVGDPLAIDVSLVGTPTYYPGSTVEYSIKVTSGVSKITGVTVMANNVIALEKEIKKLTAATVQFIYTIPATETAGSKINLLFKVVDNDNATKEKPETITVVAQETSLSDEQKDKIIYHILGEGQGAWDLVKNEGVSEGGAATRYLGDNKDMINREGTAGKEGFLAEIVAGNATRFVKKNDFDYANATAEGAETAYKAGTPHGKGQTAGTAEGWATHDPVAVAAGDIFIAKLRGEDNFAVIKIEAVDVAATAANSKITFSYKKASTAKEGGKTLMTYR